MHAQIKLELSATGPAKPGKVVKEYTLDKGNNIINFEYPMGPDPALWDEFFPNLYTLEVSLSNISDGSNDSRSTTFGLRDFIADGRQLTINGRPVFLRGTLECAIFPKTGYPSTPHS